MLGPNLVLSKLTDGPLVRFLVGEIFGDYMVGRYRDIALLEPQDKRRRPLGTPPFRTPMCQNNGRTNFNVYAES
jgi:hypothetical protein